MLALTLNPWLGWGYAFLVGALAPFSVLGGVHYPSDVLAGLCHWDSFVGLLLIFRKFGSSREEGFR